jgi:cell division ATPase FtsA
MFGFGHSDEDATYGVLIDIASGTIGVAIVASETEQKIPLILYSKRTSLRITKHKATIEEDLHRVREALLSALLILSQEGLQSLSAHNAKAKITKIYVTCTSPWSFTIARDVHYESDEPFKVNHTIISDLVHSAEEEIVSHIKSSPETEGEDFEIVERATVDMTVNDYPVSHPLNLKGTILGLSHIAGLVPKDIMTSLHEVQDKLFPDTELRVHTYMLIMYCVMRDFFPRLQSLCIINITGEATEFGIIENNLLIENTFVPYGSTTFVREIMEATGKPSSDIITNLQAHDDDSPLVEPDFSDQVESYKAKILEAVTHIRTRRIFPSDVIITAHQPYEPIFKHMIEQALENELSKRFLSLP